jgi:hypothetical protein
LVPPLPLAPRVTPKSRSLRTQRRLSPFSLSIEIPLAQGYDSILSERDFEEKAAEEA